MGYKFLLDLGLIILVVKLFSIITGKIHMPKILGGLVAGVVLGPAIFNVIQPNNTIDVLSKLAIIFIMFLAGMETSLKKFITNTRKFIVIAILGVIVPLAFGFIFSRFYTTNMSLNLFFGTVITATSVSITVESLIELKKIKTNVGIAILGAGVVDDIIGVIFLTFVLNNGVLTISTAFGLLLKILLFFALSIILAFIMFKILEWLENKLPRTEELPIFSLSFALILSYIAESLGVSGIIGAYIAGLVVGATKQDTFIKNKIDVLVYMLFAPIFFASVGLKLETLSFNWYIWCFIIFFTAITILSKVIGNGLGAKICGYKNKECLQIGIGMATRGEVALIMIDEAKSLGIINNEVFSIILITILLVTLITPILLHFSFQKPQKNELKVAEI